jgi:hypothetical protein
MLSGCMASTFCCCALQQIRALTVYVDWRLTKFALALPDFIKPVISADDYEARAHIPDYELRVLYRRVVGSFPGYLG